MLVQALVVETVVRHGTSSVADNSVVKISVVEMMVVVVVLVVATVFLCHVVCHDDVSSWHQNHYRHSRRQTV
jgi:LytS/YehU family sensor histidine kinase